MKKLLMAFIVLFALTACFKKDTMEGIEIITTTYPSEYIVDYLYGDNSIVESIYPDGTNPTTIKFNKKQIADFSEKNLYVYLGKVKSQSDLAVAFKNLNKDLLLIDGNLGIDGEYGIEEAWLDPSNMLMITRNIRNGLNEYIKSAYLNKEIDEKYNNLKIELSNLDAEFRLLAANSDRQTIVVSNDALLYLQKYGFRVISLDEKSVSDKIISEVKALIKSNQIDYVYTLENSDENKRAKELISSENINELIFRSVETIDDEERKLGKDYISIMKENIELLKEGTYNK